MDRLRRMRNATFANIGITIGTGVGYVMTGNPAFSGEAGHSSSDSLAHGTRYLAERFGIDQDTKAFKNFLRASLLVPAGFLIWNSARTGIDLLQGGEADNTISGKVINGAGALAITGANTYALVQTSGIDEHSHASNATHNHAKNDAIVSGGFSVSLGAEVVGVDNASLYGGMLFSGIAGAHLLKEAWNPHKH